MVLGVYGVAGARYSFALGVSRCRVKEYPDRILHAKDWSVCRWRSRIKQRVTTPSSGAGKGDSATRNGIPPARGAVV